MAKKTDSTIDDPDLLDDGTQVIPEYKPPDYEVIGTDGGLFGGGLGAPSGNLADVLREDITYAPGYYPGQGIFVSPDQAEQLGVDQGNIFISEPNWGGAPELTGAVPAIAPGGPAIGGGPTPIDVQTKAGTTITSEDLSQRIVDRVAQREAQAGTKLSDAQLNSVVEDVMDEIYGPVAAGGVNRQLPTGQGGIPLVIPIPGLDPASAAILTAAGLIFSGGKIARLKPSDPLGSVVDAVKGVGQTGQNIINVATGEDTLGNIWSGGTTPSGSAAGQGASGAIGVIGAGAAAAGGGGAASSAAGQQTTGGTVGVTPGAVGGQTESAEESTSTPSTGVVSIRTTRGPGVEISPSAVPIVGVPGDSVVEQVSPIRTTRGPGVNPEAVNNGSTSITGVPGASMVPDVGTGEKDTTKNPVITGFPGASIASTSTTTASTPIWTMPTLTFTKTQPGELAMRDFQKEFGETAGVLTGDPGKDLAKFYQQLQSQFTPSTLTALAGTSEQQLQSDLARYQSAMQGQLSPEDIRAAQQGAREAYAARGQVFAPGAIGAEILGRDQLMRQRQAEARQNLQQSLGNVGAAAQLQTGNIFAPFANLIAKTYGPTNEYANAVYDYNVNAYNAYQAAQENLAAYKEAAAKGQQAEFISTFANFLAKNGVQTTWNALENIFKKIGGSSGTPGT